MRGLRATHKSLEKWGLMHRPENFWGCVGVVDQVYIVGVDYHRSFREQGLLLEHPLLVP